MKLRVLIINLNNQNYTKNCTNLLLNQKFNDFKITLFDQNSNEIGTEEDVRRIADFYRWNGNEFASWDVVKNVCGIKDAYNSWPHTYEEAKAKFKIWKRAKDITSKHREGAD